MKYSQLKAQLDRMTDSELQQDAVVYIEDDDEYMPVTAFTTNPVTDVLDEGHRVIECLINADSYKVSHWKPVDVEDTGE